MLSTLPVFGFWPQAHTNGPPAAISSWNSFVHPASCLPGALPVRSGSGNLGLSVVAVWRSPAYISSISTSYCRRAVLLGPVVHVPSHTGVPVFVRVGEGVVVGGAVGVLGVGGVSAV